MSPTEPRDDKRERLALLISYLERWRDLQAETSPIDRQAAANAMSRLHQKVWGQPPRQVFCFEGPLAASIGREIWKDRRALFTDSPPYDEVRVTAKPLSFSMRLRELIEEVYFDALVIAERLTKAGDPRGMKAWSDLQRSREARLFDVKPLGLEYHLNIFSGHWTYTDVSALELRKLMGDRPIEWVERLRQQACQAMGIEAKPLSGMSEDELFKYYRKLWLLDISDEIWLRGAVNRFIEVFQIARKYELPLAENTLDWFAALFQVAATGSYGIWSDGEVAAIVERPSFISLDEEQNLHCETGPAMIWRDGYQVYSWKGRNLPSGIIENKDALTVKDVVLIENAPIRRAMIELMGKENFARQSGAQKISNDETGMLWRLEFDWFRKGDPAIQNVEGAERFKTRYWPDGDVWQAVEVTNTTPEPDGSYRTYFLEVPPDIQSAREAVAWTFGMSEQDYRPDAES